MYFKNTDLQVIQIAFTHNLEQMDEKWIKETTEEWNKQ